MRSTILWIALVFAVIGLLGDRWKDLLAFIGEDHPYLGWLVSIFEDIDKFLRFDMGMYPSFLALSLAFFSLYFAWSFIIELIWKRNRKKNRKAFDREFAETANIRSSFMDKVAEIFGDDGGIYPVIRSSGAPSGLPLDGGSLFQWAKTVPPSFDGGRAKLWKFLCSVISNNDQLDDDRRQVARFWDKIGRVVEAGELDLPYIENSIRANIHSILLLSYWEPAQVLHRGRDFGPGKAGIFALAKIAERIIRDESEDSEEMTTLKEAREKGKLEQFIREHEKDAPGDLDKLDAALKRPTSRKTKEAPKASSQRGSDD